MTASPPFTSTFSSSPSKNRDGFTLEEVQSTPVCSQVARPWKPSISYDEADLGSLEPGPRNLALHGRVVNFYDTPKPNKSPRAAQGCLRIMLADNTGVVTVRLWYAHVQYKLKLGQLVTVWTVHMSNSSEHNNLAPKSAPLFTSIFPEGERNCHFMAHDESDDDGTQYKRPSLRQNSQMPPELISLSSFAGGHDVEEPKLLVCVKTIGKKRAYLNRNGTTCESLPIGVFDNTADATLTLYSSLCDSASSFQPSKTVLLIWNPGWRIGKSMKLSLNSNSRIDIDPDMDEAQQLRAFAQLLKIKEHANLPFPDIDTTAFEEASVRALFTLAEVDDFVRSNPSQNLTGYLSVLIMKLDIVMPFKRNMLMSNQCCGFPMFANTQSAKCEHCEKDIPLRINPAILDSIIDETGYLSNGKLVLSDEAWEQLLGRTTEQLVNTNLEVLQYLEQRLSFLRVTLGFTVKLEHGVGRLAVWCVKN